MDFLKSPNVLQFIGGVVCVLLGVLVVKDQVQSMTLLLSGVAAASNALKSLGDVAKDRAEKKRASMAPPAP